MSHPLTLLDTPETTVPDAADAACRAIPPAWPLTATVAVNPYLGQVGNAQQDVAALLARVSSAPFTMPRTWFAEKFRAGAFTRADIAEALDLLGEPRFDPATLEAQLEAPVAQPAPLPTVADLAATATGTDWPGILLERFGHWASGHFDQGQALWPVRHGKSAWAGWRSYAMHDLTPEILGLKGFASSVEEAPDTATQFICETVDRLALPPDALATYLHQLLLGLGGWSHLARYRGWIAEQDGDSDETLLDVLAIRLFWERVLYDHVGQAIEAPWSEAVAAHSAPLAPSDDQLIDAVLQLALELAAQRKLADLLVSAPAETGEDRPELQAAFCIDVRSEVFRRALEAQGDAVETLGFAGFFGLPIAHHAPASDIEERRLPVLLTPALSTRSCLPEAEDRSRRITARAIRAWGRFRQAAVSSFAFVESAGVAYAGKLALDGFGLKTKAEKSGPPPRLDPAIGADARLDAAETVLRAMSLTSGFARLVVLAGHGANVVNNPHASALHCGACGGYAGDVNARLLAGLLNDPDVRDGLSERGMPIPADTVFVGALHDTTTDAITLYEGDADMAAHGADLAKARSLFAAATEACRAERAGRLPRAVSPGDVARRARNWAETRPEWGLAGCNAFIAAPRERTSGRDLQGRAFLHNYDWRADRDFGTLELILTAPVVVASWISLQYYGSSVAPDLFGAGNKLLHNVVGGIGVFEGNGGALRTGLPLQSVHDGERLVHEPVKLSVCVEAPRDAILTILERHPDVRALFENGWLHLFALDDAGALRWRYRPGLAWAPVDIPSAEPLMEKVASC